MTIFRNFAAAATLILAVSSAQADQKQDAFYMLLDDASDNPLLHESLQLPLVEMLLNDAQNRGLGLADMVLLRANRGIGAWYDDLMTSRNLAPERLDTVLIDKLALVPKGTETSGLMRLLQTTSINCAVAETVTVYILTNLVSSITLDSSGAHLETAPSISLAGCDLVFVGPTLGSPELSLREVQHIDDLINNLSTHSGADSYVVLR